jgi:phage virion morphogenesis protein
MAVAIAVKTEGIKELQEAVKNKLEHFRNIRSPLSNIATLMYKSVMQNFQEEGTDKEKWKPLSWFTLWVKSVRSKKKTKTPKILQDTGYLRMSISPETTENSAIVGTNVKYGRLHQFGGVSEPGEVEVGPFYRNYPSTYRGRPVKPETIAKRRSSQVRVSKFVMHFKGGHKIPARPFLYLREKHKEMIKETCRKWFFYGRI